MCMQRLQHRMCVQRLQHREKHTHKRQRGAECRRAYYLLLTTYYLLLTKGREERSAAEQVGHVVTRSVEHLAHEPPAEVGGGEEWVATRLELTDHEVL